MPYCVNGQLSPEKTTKEECEHLGQLQEMHTKLPTELAVLMLGQAAMALERSGHLPGARLLLEMNNIRSSGRLTWLRADLSTIEQHDRHRVTELGAETVALVLAHRYWEWRIVRRMQRREFADWLLEDVRGNEIALEVSGVDSGNIAARLSDKLKQVAKNVDIDQRWASVVGFQEPSVVLRSI